MKDYKRFWGSYAALILGFFALASGAAQQSSLLIGGWYMILGSLSYISAKKRKLGLVKENTLRRVFELIGMAIIFALVVLSNRADLINDPFPNLVIPIWAIIAYFIAFSRRTIANGT